MSENLKTLCIILGVSFAFGVITLWAGSTTHFTLQTYCQGGHLMIIGQNGRGQIVVDQHGQTIPCK